jgi:sugar (pentulose or hexulose) kinase
MTNPLLLAIDLGTSGPKVALYTATGELLAGRQRADAVDLYPRRRRRTIPSGVVGSDLHGDADACWQW